LVASGTTILAEARADSRDFSTATHSILAKIPPNNSKLTYVWENYLFHYISEGGYVYLVMADDSAGRRMPFAFLGEVKDKVRRHLFPDPQDENADLPTIRQ
jgi:vesicle-associated membrane protein 7